MGDRRKGCRRENKGCGGEKEGMLERQGRGVVERRKGCRRGKEVV